MGAETRFVKPREGLIVRDPNTKSPMPESGAEIPWVGSVGKFYRRRARQGDIVIISRSNDNIIEKDEIIKEAVTPKETLFKDKKKKEDKIDDII